MGFVPCPDHKWNSERAGRDDVCNRLTGYGPHKAACENGDLRGTPRPGSGEACRDLKEKIPHPGLTQNGRQNYKEDEVSGRDAEDDSKNSLRLQDELVHNGFTGVSSVPQDTWPPGPNGRIDKGNYDQNW